MQVRKLKRILKDTEAQIIQVEKHVFKYLNEKFELTESFTVSWSIGSLTTYEFETEEEVKRKFAKSKLFVQSCPDGDNLTVRAFIWRPRPWLK